MKNTLFLLFLFFSGFALAIPPTLTADFEFGNPQIQSIHALTFGPEHILFVGDAQSAAVVAVDLSKSAQKAEQTDYNLSNVDQQVADLLGTTKDAISITDMAVDPASNQIYLSAHAGDGTPVLLHVAGEKLEHVPLDAVSFSRAALENPVDTDAKDGRGRDLRRWAISDLRFADGKVMVTGLSNKEFGSTFRLIEFPFRQQQSYASLEIYHVSHGQYETDSPVKTFIPLQLNGKMQMVAGYTCTPLVVFPLDQLHTGKHTKGRTVAELGNWNTPLDLIEMENDGARFLLLANSNRALMKFKIADIEAFEGSLTNPLAERSGTDGVGFIALPFVNVLQLDKLNDETFVMLQREANGNLVLKTGNSRWL
jgi:hypothetical protein